MNISEVQKRKFLNNIHKLYYSSGKKPSDHSIRTAFTKYFSVNKFGDPVTIDTSQMQVSSIIDHNMLNELMVNTLLNLEVLYECVMENNQEIYGVVNALNDKLDNLRAKRKELESKVDQLLFSINNTDGFFYSYLDNFSGIEKIDMGMTTAYIDLVNNNVSIPKIVTSTNLQTGSLSTVSPASVTYSILFNNEVVVDNAPVSNFDLTLDGLNDTFWSYQHSFSAPGIVALVLNMPVSIPTPISKVSGSIMSSTPCSTFMRAIPASSANPEVIKSRDSKGDYNRFSFVIPSINYSNISLTFYKSEPDRIVNSESSPYTYEFGIRELNVSADYHEQRAQLVSSPIYIPTSDNELLSISAVSIEVDHQVNSGVDISYFVAADVENGSSISDFDWIPIEPTNINSQEQPKIVNLLGPTQANEMIGFGGEGSLEPSNYYLIPMSTESANINDLNPVTLPFYPDKTVYRVARLNESTKYLQPYMLANLETFRYHAIINLNYSTNVNYMYKSLEDWADRISATSDLELSSGVFQNTNSSITVPRNEPHSGLLETSLFCDQDKIVSHEIIKSQIDGQDMNVAVYLNGVLIADLPSGQTKTKIEWNFVKGINNITISYDKSFSGKPMIDLMVSRNLTDYGTIFLDYFSYLDPIDFGRKVNSEENIFTITQFYGSKEILASNQISNKTILRYYLDKADLVTAVRYRADLFRYANPLQTPVIDAIRVRFKHNDV
jgi:hypothetical protein